LPQGADSSIYGIHSGSQTVSIHRLAVALVAENEAAAGRLDGLFISTRLKLPAVRRAVQALLRDTRRGAR